MINRQKLTKVFIMTCIEDHLGLWLDILTDE